MGTKVYIVKGFDSNQQLEDFINKNSLAYDAISISDSNRCITVLMKLRGYDDRLAS
jgi:hypothetical protein